MCYKLTGIQTEDGGNDPASADDIFLQLCRVISAEERRNQITGGTAVKLNSKLLVSLHARSCSAHTSLNMYQVLWFIAICCARWSLQCPFKPLWHFFPLLCSCRGLYLTVHAVKGCAGQQSLHINWHNWGKKGTQGLKFISWTHPDVVSIWSVLIRLNQEDQTSTNSKGSNCCWS